MSENEYLAHFDQGGADGGLEPMLNAGVTLFHPLFRGRKATGTEAILTSANPSADLVKVEGPGEGPELIGVQIDVKSTEDAPDERVRLEIEWGTGAIHRAVIDAVNGTEFATNGRTLHVRAVLENGSGPITVKATTGVGAAGAAPTRTIHHDTAIAPTVIGEDLLPSYARSVRVYRIPVTEAFAVQLLGAAPLLEVRVPGFADCPEIWVPNGAFRIRVRNDGAADITYKAIHRLALGGG